jgi:diguanylate cyclase (GGDEF)-like protein/PAS domain S-box-containing protein
MEQGGVPAHLWDRTLLRASRAGAVLGVLLFAVAVRDPSWAIAAGWAVAVLCASIAALAASRASRRADQPPESTRVWRRIALALTVAAALALGYLIDWLVPGADAGDRVSVPHAVAHLALIVVFVAPIYRLPSNTGDQISSVLEVGAMVLVTSVFMWIFPVRHLLRGHILTAPLTIAAVAVIASAALGMLLGARIVFTGVRSPYRRMLLVLGAAVAAGGIAPGPQLALLRSDLDIGLLLIPVAGLVLTVGARPGGRQRPPDPELIERWRRRYELLPFVAVACTDALLIGVLIGGGLQDRVVVGVTSIVLTVIAVVRQVRSAGDLRRQERRFRQLVQNSYDVVTINRPDGTITYMSGGSQRMFGRAPQQRTGANIFELLHADDRSRIEGYFADVIADPARTVLWRSRFRHADGSWRRIEVLTTNMLDEPSIRGIVCNSRDVTEAHDLAERLSYDATHDSLTGLANRALFADRLAEALTGDGAHRLSLVLVDLDDFKLVNDTLGHTAGDRLLVAVADRLRHTVRVDDMVSRLGGDEFAILLPGHGRAAAERVLKAILDGLREPVELEGRGHVVRASFGVVEGAPGDEAGDLMRRADIAMYEAKARGDGGWQHYLPGMQARGAELDRATADLRRGLDAGEMFVLYQPVVTLPGGDLAGTETLVRWQHPERGLVGPLEFIPLAEQSGLIVELGRWVLGEACRQMAAWGGAAPPTINVNVSARQLREPAFADEVARVLRDTGLDARRLTVEITESTAVGGEATGESLSRLRRLGVRLSLDDFGTGQSTLTLLATCPVDQIKLDRSFVPDEQSDVIAAAVRQLARGFGVEAVAEGVETAVQAARLTALGYDRAQGYHFGRPMPAGDLIARFRAAAVSR